MREGESDYLLWIGRMVDFKGPHRAIAVAKAAGRPLILAGPVRPGQEAFFAEHVEPHIDGRRCRYVGEVDSAVKRSLFARAAGLLMPIRWPEPFGMVMIEALTTGTPVISFPDGASSEIVVSGQNGFLVDDEDQMAAAVADLGDIDPQRCRAGVLETFDVQVVTAKLRGRLSRGTGPDRGRCERSLMRILLSMMGRPALPSPSARRFEAVVLDLSQAAVADLAGEPGRMRSAVETGCALGLHVAIIADVSLPEIDGWLLARP